MTTTKTPTATQNLTAEEIGAHVPEPVNYEEAIEAILFAAGHPVTYDKLSQTFDLSPSKIKSIVSDYAKKYNSGKLPRGVMLIMFDTGCQLCTKEQYIQYIRSALGIRKSGTLSASSIETLAIIAYHQPVTRAYVDAVRGVDSSYAVTNLQERGLIEPRGRKDAPGRPTLFGTTDSFLRCFGLSSLAELPGIESEEIGKVFSAIEDKMAVHEEDSADQLSIEDLQQTTADKDDEKLQNGEASASEEEKYTDSKETDMNSKETDMNSKDKDTETNETDTEMKEKDTDSKDKDTENVD